MDFFATCLPGLEPLLVDEMAAAGLGRKPPQPGGVAFSGDRSALYRANLELGLATSVLVRIGKFEATALPELERKTAELNWSKWIDPRRPRKVKANCRGSRLYHSGAVEQRVDKGIAAALGPQRGSGGADAEPQIIRVRVRDDEILISFDSSGDPLYRRGWRLDVGKAPLRPDLARALVLCSGWDRKSPLLDPFCGSGTIAIEAALLARRRPPGALRSFGFQNTPLHDEDLFKKVRETALGRALNADDVVIHASDRDAGAVKRTRENAQRADVDGGVIVTEAAVAAAPYLCGTPVPPERGVVVTNPPFGRRVGSWEQLRPLYQTLGHRVSKLPMDWRIAFLAADRRLGHATGLKVSSAFVADHGGMTINALTGR